MAIENQVASEITEDQEFCPDWGENAPKGGRTVLNRVLKDSAKVPLFLGHRPPSPPCHRAPITGHLVNALCQEI